MPVHTQMVMQQAWADIWEELSEIHRFVTGAFTITGGRHPFYGNLVAVEGGASKSDGVVIHSERFYVTKRRSAKVVPMQPEKIVGCPT